MKKCLFALLGVAALLAGCRGSAPKEEAEAGAAERTEVSGGDIAFVRMDSLWLRSDLYRAEGLPLQDKLVKAQESWTKRQNNLQYEANQLQEKYQKGLITSIQAAQTQDDLQKKAQNFQASQQREAAQLDEEGYVLQNRFNDAAMTVIQELNATGRYRLILTSAVVLDGDPSLDITDEVLTGINARYAAEKRTTGKGE